MMCTTGATRTASTLVSAGIARAKLGKIQLTRPVEEPTVQDDAPRKPRDCQQRRTDEACDAIGDPSLRRASPEPIIQSRGVIRETRFEDRFRRKPARDNRGEDPLTAGRCRQPRGIAC